MRKSGSAIRVASAHHVQCMTFATCTSGSAPLISPCAYTPSLAVSHPQSPLVCAINCAEQQRRFPRTSPKVRVRRRRRRRLDFSATRSARQVKSRVTWSSRIAWPRTRVTCRRRSTSSSKSDACSARFDHITSENPRTEEAAPFPVPAVWAPAVRRLGVMLQHRAESCRRQPHRRQGRSNRCGSPAPAVWAPAVRRLGVILPHRAECGRRQSHRPQDRRTA